MRAFNDGIGFRYDLPDAPAKSSREFVLEEDQTQFSFPGNYVCYASTNENTGTATNRIGYTGSQESDYLSVHLADLPTNQVRMMPLLVQTPAAWVAITESDLFDWAGMWLNRVPPAGDASSVTLRARLSPRLDGQGLVKSAFPRLSLWRTLIIGRQPGRLVESDLVLNLASPCVLADTTWVKAGMSSWDWWSQVARPSTATYRDLIEFSAEMGWPYALLDAGWSSRGNIMMPNPSVNRCAELALFVCLESPVMNACDNPIHYRGQPGLDFLKIVPTVWDDTRVLDGAVAEHMVIVRRNGNRWFLGALTNSKGRDIPVKLDFLGAGSWTVTLWKDAPDSGTEGTHLVIEKKRVTSADLLTLQLARAGGAVACFEPVSPQP